MAYPDQALKRGQEALTLARELAHPPSLALALFQTAGVYGRRREWQAVQEQTAAAMRLSHEQGLPYWLTMGTIQQGLALAKQGQKEEGISQMRQGLATLRATGAETARMISLPLLAEAYEEVGQAEEGLSVLAEILATVEKTGQRIHEAELYRLKGELTLQKFQVSGSKFQESPKSEVRGPESEAEECFLKSIEIARRQQAKSLELRAVMSLSRLWQQQGKKAEAQQMLAEIYHWFTEGFDTADLQEAKKLLEELA